MDSLSKVLEVYNDVFGFNLKKIERINKKSGHPYYRMRPEAFENFKRAAKQVKFRNYFYYDNMHLLVCW